MSLRQVYNLAHTAECRLQIAAGRPDKDLRFVVGHLMHYESLRLRIVEIEHDIGRSQRAQAVQFQGTGHVGVQQLRQKPSTGQLGKRSPPPSAIVDDDDGDDDDDDGDDDDDDGDSDSFEEDEGEGEDLGLTRFASGSTRPPALEVDGPDDPDEDMDELISPEEPDRVTLEQVLKKPADNNMAQSYEGVRRCSCHGHTDAPVAEHMWELPRKEGDKEGVTRAVVQVVG